MVIGPRSTGPGLRRYGDKESAKSIWRFSKPLAGIDHARCLRRGLARRARRRRKTPSLAAEDMEVSPARADGHGHAGSALLAYATARHLDPDLPRAG